MDHPHLSLLLILPASVILAPHAHGEAAALEDLARQHADTLRLSTLFTAQNVRDHLADEDGLRTAIQWCRDTAVTHVYIETFRSNYWADREVLERARDRFAREGLLVSGCVTTTNVGKLSTGWDLISCYTDRPTRDTIRRIFEHTASLFDEIMIDDFLFTDCACPECRTARGDSAWADYRCRLMEQVSRDDILGAARAVNPKAKIIIKYPQWYDDFHNRGYDVAAETKLYDKIWVGTETRDYDDPRWGGTVQYEAYFIMRWLGVIGGRKCGGGWFDPYGTTADTYVEQARQTVLAGAREALLFCYGSLQRDTGPANVEKLRAEIPQLFELANIVQGRRPRGVATCKPPNSDAGPEKRIFDFVGMLGLPLVPSPTVDARAQSAFFSVHALRDSQFVRRLQVLIARGGPVLLTSNLADRLGDKLDPHAGNVHVLGVEGDPKSLLELTQEQLDPLRDAMLAPYGITFHAPNRVALYLLGRDVVAVENFNDQPVPAGLTMAGLAKARLALALPAGADVGCTTSPHMATLSLPPRSLAVLKIQGG